MSTPSTASNDCLFTPTVDDWVALDDERLILFGSGRKEAFLARLSVPVPGLLFETRVAVIDDDRNGRICGNGADGIAFGQNSSVPGKILIASLQKIDATEVERLIAESKGRGRKGIPQPPAETPR